MSGAFPALPEGCEPACPGCRHRELSAAQSGARKSAWLARALAPWADRLEALRAPPPAERWAYRDKVTLTAEWAAGRWRLGLRRRGEVVDIPYCPVHSPRTRAMVGALTAVLPDAARLPFAFYAQSGRQAALVVKARAIDDVAWVRDLMPTLDACGMDGLWLHLNPAAGRRVFAKREWRLLWGQARSHGGDGLWYSVGAFQQVLPGLHGAALDEAEAFLAPGPEAWVIDLYCGAGASLHRWIARRAQTLGVESSREAAACAADNVPAASVLLGHCATRLPQLRAFAAGAGRRLLYANPPRTGLEPAVLDWIARDCRPQRLAYLSCSAGTLARDLERLCAHGFRVERLLPFDFFPQTHHVEALALVSGPVS